MLLSKEELEQSSVLHPQVAEFFAAAQIPAPLVNHNSYAAVIKDQLKYLSAAVVSSLGAPPEGTVEFYKQIPMRDGFNSSLKIHRPADGGGPLIVLAFGGGFIGGDNDQLSGEARTLVKLFGATVVSINYRVGPEDKFPAAQHDAWDSMIWIAENASGEDLKSDPSKAFIMGGVSAGGCLTATLSRKFQEAPLAHPLTGQWLCIPPTMMPEHAPDKYRSYHVSREQNANAPGLTKDNIAAMIEVNKINVESELAFAVNSKTPISLQPRTYLQVAGADPLRDDGLIYHEMLREAGVDTKIDFYPGCTHGYQMMMANTELGKKGAIDTMVGFGWLLGKDVGRDEVAGAMGIA